MTATLLPLTGAVIAAAVLLLVTGATKLLRPDPTAAALLQAGLTLRPRLVARGVAVVELGIAGLLLVVGGPLATAAVAAAYAAFTGFVLVALRRPERIRTCGCAGTEAPPTIAHAVVTAGFAGCAAGTAILGGIPSVGGVLTIVGAPEGAVLIACAGVAALLAWAVVAVLPLTLRPVSSAGSSRPGGA